MNDGRVAETYTAQQLSTVIKQGGVMISYVMAGYPTQSETVPLLHTLSDAGTDIIELGVPFSEPVADGKVISEAAEIAIQNGTTLATIFTMVRQARDQGLGTPIVLMGYYHSFYSFGLDSVVVESQMAGVNGFLVVDLPLDLDDTFMKLATKYNRAMIPLISPTTPTSRICQLSTNTNDLHPPSFLYVVSGNGTTGSQTTLTSQTGIIVERIRKASNLPIAVGFGISTPEHATEVWKYSDGVVVGTAIIRVIRDTWEASCSDVSSQESKTDLPEVDWQPVTEFIRDITKYRPIAPLIKSPVILPNTLSTPHDSLTSTAYYGNFGGQYLPESLLQAHRDLEQWYGYLSNDPEFKASLDILLRDYVGRPTPLYRTRRLASGNPGVEIWLKREDLCFTGSHKLNNALAQAYLAKHMGKTRIIAETGAGQHGVATATACSLLELDCVVYMGETDIDRQSKNVTKMRLLGATVKSASNYQGRGTLRDAINGALRDWVTHVDTSYYLIGSAVGAHPYPTIVRDFQSVIGREAREQFTERTGGDPDVVVACVGGGSNAIGIFSEFLSDSVNTRLIGVEASGAASVSEGKTGILHGSRSLVVQTPEGGVAPTHSISAGLDYPGVSPIHAWLHRTGRVEYTTVTDQEAVEAFHRLNHQEGIPPALESAHAVAAALRLAKQGLDSTRNTPYRILVNLSGRGDKDIDRMSNTSE
jgi:tryptophan synthase